MNYITVEEENSNSIKLYHKDWGSGQPVVFSHGWPLSADAWEDQMVFLASRGYPGAPHGMCSTLKDQVNEDLLTFIKG